MKFILKSIFLIFIINNIKAENWSVDFLIIGAAKCGTTSLYNYLIQHPDILPAIKKEIHFFDFYYDYGLEWYKTKFKKKYANKIIGEASPFYLYHPQVAERVFKTLPKTKLIILLRNPVERAISHYFFCKPNLDFETALKQEYIVYDELNKMKNNQEYNIHDIRYYSYLSRGIYIDQIKRWRQFFPKNQMLIIFSEELFNDPQKTVDKVFKFLNVSKFILNSFEIHNKNFNKQEIKIKTKEKLKQYFSVYNKQLEEYLKVKLPW